MVNSAQNATEIRNRSNLQTETATVEPRPKTASEEIKPDFSITAAERGIHRVTRTTREARPAVGDTTVSFASTATPDATTGSAVRGLISHERQDLNRYPATPAAEAVNTRNEFTALDRAEPSAQSTWIHAGTHRAEAGFLDPSFGWITIKAEGHGYLASGCCCGSHLAGSQRNQRASACPELSSGAERDRCERQHGRTRRVSRRFASELLAQSKRSGSRATAQQCSALQHFSLHEPPARYDSTSGRKARLRPRLIL